MQQPQKQRRSNLWYQWAPEFGHAHIDFCHLRKGLCPYSPIYGLSLLYPFWVYQTITVHLFKLPVCPCRYTQQIYLRCGCTALLLFSNRMFQCPANVFTEAESCVISCKWPTSSKRVLSVFWRISPSLFFLLAFPKNKRHERCQLKVYHSLIKKMNCEADEAPGYTTQITDTTPGLRNVSSA